MPRPQTRFIDVSRLRVGMYIHLDLGWMDHPFTLSNFKITSDDQIETIRRLGLKRVRYVPEKSEAAPRDEVAVVADVAAKPASEVGNEAVEQAAKRARTELLAAQRAVLKQCERRYQESAQAYRRAIDNLPTRPEASGLMTVELVRTVVGELNDQGESCIRLLSERVGEASQMHAVNVMVLSLLLGRACGMDAAALAELGAGALLHDVGKTELPRRVHSLDSQLTPAEQLVYQDHVRLGVAIGRKMGLGDGAVAAIGQHHERADALGFPNRTGGNDIAEAGRVVALVNRYDNLCNPANPTTLQTPHEALASIFAQQRGHFDSTVLSTFIRMMGVYPPGSVVELSNGRFALVVSVNSTRPLKPRVIIHDPAVPADQALVVDLERLPELGVRRSLKPLQLPRAAFDYLSPQRRICYFFERASELPGEVGTP